MPPSRMNRSVQSTNHTSDNTTNIIITETSTKTFYRYYFLIRNMLQNNFSHAMFLREGIWCHAIELFIDYEHRCLTACNCTAAASRNLILKWLNSAVLPLHTVEDLISSRISWRFSKEQHGDVHVFSSFRFVHQIAVSPKKFRRYGRF